MHKEWIHSNIKQNKNLKGSTRGWFFFSNFDLTLQGRGFYNHCESVGGCRLLYKPYPQKCTSSFEDHICMKMDF